MKRLHLLSVVCYLSGFIFSGEVVKASDAFANVSAGDCEGGGNDDFDMGAALAVASTSDTDPQFGTASADAGVAGPSLLTSGDAAVFTITAWCSSGGASFNDVLEFSFPVDSLTGLPEDLEVELTAEFSWSIDSNGGFVVVLQDRVSHYVAGTGFIFNDFDLPATDSGFATIVLARPFDLVEIDPFDPEFYRAELSLAMSLNGGTTAADPLLGGTPSTSFSHMFDLTDLRVLEGTEEIEVEIESESGEGYEFEVLTADFDDDGDVDGRDFLIWQRGFGTPNAELGDGDSNDDGNVDDFDLEVWQDQYGEPGHLSGLVSVPEPASSCLLLTSALLITLSRSYRCREFSSIKP